MPLRVAALFRYPLKSAAGLSCGSLDLDRFGVVGDRRWLIADPDGQPVTQREEGRLVLLSARDDGEGLALAADGRPGLVVRPPAPDATRRTVTIWGDAVEVQVADRDAATWLSDLLGREAWLAFLPPDVERPVNPRYGRASDLTSLTDGFPLHLVGSGSLADLNARLETDIGIERFRPNVFVQGTEPYEEDDWERIRIGEATLRVVKPCARCTVTTVDPRTGRRGDEPLRTLSRYRKRPGGVMFGQNVLHDGRGTLRVGDPVEVVSRRDAPAA